MATAPSSTLRFDELASLRAELDDLFPTPGTIERAWLYRALAGVAEDVPWLSTYFEAPTLSQQLRGLEQQALATSPAAHRGAHIMLLAGDHGLAGAMIGEGTSSPPTGLQTLRGLLWLAMRRARSSAAPFQSSAEDIAGPIRAAIRSARSPAAVALGEPLARLGTASTIDTAILALDQLILGEHRRLIVAWREWLRPALEAMLEHQEPLPPTAPPPTTDPAPPRDKGKPREENEPEVTSAPRVIPLVPNKPHPDQHPYEPTGEFDSGQSLVIVPGFGNGKYSRARATYRASQAIWSGNHLLLTTHPDALPADVFGAALRSLVRQLLEEDIPAPRARGLCGCLLKAITSRTTQGLAALQLSPPATGEPLMRDHLDLDAGRLLLPPYWKLDAPQSTSTANAAAPTYFRPTPEQRALLVPVTDQILLPLMRPVHRALTKHRELLATLATLEDLTIFDAEMAEAAKATAREIDVPIRVANLRRSLGPLVMEVTGDLAVAQLICGASFGKPSAQQNYFAPKRGDLAAAYVSAIGHCLGDNESPRIPEPGLRVGSELLVTASAAKSMAQASYDHCETGDNRKIQPSAVAWHRRLLDHFVRMMMASAGHRPAEALFELTLGDIDLGSGAALFRDKRHDHAHDPRLACLPSLLCRQLEVYLDHLSTVAAEAPSAAPEIQRILTGEAPLLVDITNQGEVTRPTIATVLARSPGIWQVVPPNWGRTYLRTRGIELGGPAFLLACQLGHFDAVGYPYSNQSPTDPIEAIECVRPVLDRLIVSQGWKVLIPDGTASKTARAPAASEPLAPLRDWSEQLESNERLAAESDARWERQLRTDARRQREAAVETVLAHPDLVAAGIPPAFAAAQDAPLNASLGDLELPRIRQELVVACGDDAAAAVARLRALRLVIGRVARQQRETAPPLPIPIAIRRPLDNPFFRGACLALTQVEALRRHVRARSAAKSPTRDLIRQTARAAEALCLFGGIDDLPTVLGLLAARGKAIASASIPDLLLAPLDDGRVIALRGVAALSLGALARAFPDAPVPKEAAIDDVLAELLPSWALPQAKGDRQPLRRLCSTVRVANRFELSPAARFAADPERGCVPASLAEQIAYIDRDPVGPVRETPAERTDPERALLPRANGKASATKQYNRLVSMLPRARKPLNLPLTGKTVSATELDLKATRDAVVAELDSWMAMASQPDGDTLFPIVYMLASWTRVELKRLKDDGKSLANSSVLTYLTRFAKPLVEALGDSDASRWDGSEIETAYEEALGMSTDAKHKVAAQLLSFHKHCEEQFDLPEVDLALVYSHLGRHERRVDAGMILPVERQRAVAAIADAAESESAEDFSATRIARVADFTMLLLAEGGARISEPLGLQLRDLGMRPNGALWAWLRPNRLRSMKTTAGRRVIHLDRTGDGEHQKRAWRWITSMRRSAGARRPGATYVTQDAMAHAFGDHPAVVRSIRSALAKATGRRSERLHRLRHLVATERITRTVLAAEDAAWAQAPVAEPLFARTLQPRDLHTISVPLGHAHWITTLSCYLHIPWLLQSRHGARLRERYFTRQTVAAALGYTPFALDELLRGARTKDPLNAWFDRFRTRRTPRRHDGASLPRVDSIVKSEQDATLINWTAQRLGALVDQAWQARDLFAALVVVGAPLSEAERIERAAARWETKLGLRLLPEHIGERRRACPSRAIRRLHDDAALESLWRHYDEGDDSVRKSISHIAGNCFSYLTPSREHRLLLPREHVVPLKALLAAVGVPEEQVTVDDVAGDLALISIERVGRQNPGKKGLGLKRVLAVVGMASWLSSPTG